MSETAVLDKIKTIKNKPKKNLNIEPHPNLILLIKVDTSITPSGIILSEESDRTPVGEIISTGSNIKLYKKGDFVYLDPNRMGLVEIERQMCLTTYEDGVIGKIVRTEK